MRIIKEIIRTLLSLLFGKQYVSVELPEENSYEVSGMKLEEFYSMIDDGRINEAENIILTKIDYRKKEEIAAAILFYEYIGEKEEAFLQQNHYSREEVLDGLKRLAQKAGYSDLVELLV